MVAASVHAGLRGFLMSVSPQARVVIKHLSGSKINQVEQFPLKDLQEITIGRDPSSDIAYDQRRDDVVSRRHAAIRLEGEGEDLAFWLRDLNSSNGTLLNGGPVTDEVDLLPEDTIELGAGGPKFTFDVQPRPESLASRTRVMGAIDATASRAVASLAGTAEHHANADGTKEIGSALTTGTRESRGRSVVGKDTVLRMLFQEREKSTRIWMSSLAAVIAVLIVAGGGLYWHSRTVANQVREEAAQRSEQARVEVQNVSRQLGVTAHDIASKYGNSTVKLEVAWRMHDMQTGKPLFHRVVWDKKTSKYYPAFVRASTGRLYRWLTVEDPDRRNIPIRGDYEGSGFVVTANGLILTNKHLAAAWMVRFRDVGTWVNPDKKGIVFLFDKKRRQKSEYVSLESTEVKALQEWIPEFGYPVFSQKEPVLLDGAQTLDDPRAFNGVNERLTVRFPGERLSTNASLVRASTDADVALIRIEPLGGLKPLELAEDDKLEVGDRVIVLGYPEISPQTEIRLIAVENTRVTARKEFIPDPTVNEGIISVLGQKFRQEGDFTLKGEMGDTFQMSINATGTGNSGGPVFNPNGKVIGLFTYVSPKDQEARATYAVPIHHGRALLKTRGSGL
jgi:serine protease Do